MKNAVIGILAHVDAGKTTLSEGMLYLSGSIKKIGRVDHGDAFLDNFWLERQRGITIFSKQANLTYKDTDITLLDTPGHVDFSAEMERTLQVLDYAVLVISGTDGVQGHTKTLWQLLKMYKIPTYIFVNKMDITTKSYEELIKDIRKNLSENCIDFKDEDGLYENIAMCDENVLNSYLEDGNVSKEDIKRLINERKVFPCFFGAALKMQEIETLLDAINDYCIQKEYDKAFGAKVFKISRDNKGNRLTYIKVNSGSIKVKDIINYNVDAEEYSEKVNQIRIYSGEKFDAVSEVGSGKVCTLTGLTKTFAGQGLGVDSKNTMNYLVPVMSYVIVLPENEDANVFFNKLKDLEEENPELHLIWNETFKEIHVELMGEIQLEVLKSLIMERFNVEVGFSQGSIVYKETIENTVEGVGHFEPLRHYAEVHLLMEPGERGSGLVFATDCSEDILDRNWQRLIMTHLNEKSHKGVLLGADITDMKITVVSGRAHPKHTEGGDFRQATYRAVRQGLKSARSILLEPYYKFMLELPADNIGRAMNDLQGMQAKFGQPDIMDDFAMIEGTAPVSLMQGYMSEVNTYTKGRGKLSLSLSGYDICHNAEEVIDNSNYDSELDVENPTGSVFCAHGSGYIVPWDEVKNNMHMPCLDNISQYNLEDSISNIPIKRSSAEVQDEDELKAIFERTYGPVKTRMESKKVNNYSAPKEKEYTYKPVEKLDEYLLVDGYNVIFADSELNELSKLNLEAARGKLIDILCNYQGYKGCTVILVFDAYKVKGNLGEVKKYNNIYVVYTKEAETADMYIEKAVHRMNKKYSVTVATSDALEQLIIMGQNALRISSREFMCEVKRISEESKARFLDDTEGTNNFVIN